MTIWTRPRSSTNTLGANRRDKVAAKVTSLRVANRSAEASKEVDIFSLPDLLKQSRSLKVAGATSVGKGLCGANRATATGDVEPRSRSCSLH